MLDSEIYNCITVQFYILSELWILLVVCFLLCFSSFWEFCKSVVWQNRCVIFRTNDRHLQHELLGSVGTGMLGFQQIYHGVIYRHSRLRWNA
jgi:hypothetical protein